MSVESFFGLTSLLSSKKEILWIGSESEAPTPTLTPLLNNIKFVTFKNAERLLDKTKHRVVVLSLNYRELERIAQLAPALMELPDIERILVVQGPKGEFLGSEVLKAINNLSFREIVLLPDGESNLLAALSLALEDQKSIRNQHERLAKVKSENQILADEASSLNAVINRQSLDSTISKQEIERKISEMRELVRYIKDLSTIVSAEDILKSLRSEIKHFHKVKEPILAYANNVNQLQLLYFQGSQTVSKSVAVAWSQQVKNRLNDLKDSQFLANIFGRPFGKLLTVPLHIRRKSGQNHLKVSAVLFFEHDLNKEEMSLFLQFIEARLLPITITLDRILLEHDLHESSMLWESTFDGLYDPVAIFDENGNLLRGNRVYYENLKDAPIGTEDQNIIYGDKTYQIHSYPINFDGVESRPHVIKHFVDVTAAQRLQRQMIQNEKMAALGHLAGHIAHELNNPLTGIRSLAQILLQKEHENQNMASDLKEVETAAERCQLIIKNLLEFSSGGEANHAEVVSLNVILERTLPLLKTLVNKFDSSIELTKESDLVLVEPHLLQQVVFNIINNAAQAMGDRGRLTIKTFSVHENGLMHALSVSDTGPGIPPEIKKQIFDFFFTTNHRGKGRVWD